MKYLITHDGYPHADDILSYALLSTVYPEWKLVRTRDESIINMPEDCEDKIVFDVGMKFDGFHYFDHHQKEKKMRDEIIPFSAFGLIWNEFGYQFLRTIGIQEIKKVWERIDHSFVRLIDIGDNGVVCSETLRVSDPFSIGRMLSKAATETDEDFVEVSRYAAKLLIGLCKEAESELVDEQVVLDGVFPEDMNRTCIVLEKELGTLSSMKVHPNCRHIFFVITPRKEKWQLSTLSDTPFVPRLRISPIAAGLSGDELVAATGIEDLEFCHGAAFMAVGKTKESLLELVKLTLKGN